MKKGVKMKKIAVKGKNQNVIEYGFVYQKARIGIVEEIREKGVTFSGIGIRDFMPFEEITEIKIIELEEED